MKTFLKSIVNYEEEKGLAFRFRQKRAALFKSFIAENFDSSRPIRVIDMGGTEVFWKSIGYEFLREKNIRIDILNLEHVPIENADIFQSFVGDACSFKSDTIYDVCFSNSVIEHVGGIERILDFSERSRNIARTYFIQTPNFYFPIEPHFAFPGFQWLPIWIRVKLVSWFSIGHFPKAENLIDARRIVESCNLLTGRLFGSLFFDGVIHREMVAGLCKSMIAIRGISTQPAE